eukprot:UN2331
MFERRRHLRTNDNSIAPHIGIYIALRIDNRIALHIGDYVALPIENWIVLYFHAALRGRPDHLCLDGVPRRPLGGFSWRSADVQDELLAVISDDKSFVEPPVLPLDLKRRHSDAPPALAAQPTTEAKDAARNAVMVLVVPLGCQQVLQQLVPLILLHSVTSQHLRHSLAGKVRHALAGWQCCALGGTVHDVDQMRRRRLSLSLSHVEPSGRRGELFE